jgi:hypothetical protein
LDVSRNNLTDEDGHHITKLVTDMLTECAFVDLSVNRFQCKDTEWLLGIQKLDRVTTVDITLNSIASEDCRMLLKNADNSLKKLIFVPEYWLAGDNWRVNVGDSNEEEEITSVHMNYYNNKKR